MKTFKQFVTEAKKEQFSYSLKHHEDYEAEDGAPISDYWIYRNGKKVGYVSDARDFDDSMMVYAWPHKRGTDNSTIMYNHWKGRAPTGDTKKIFAKWAKTTEGGRFLDSL